ncbi:MAG: helix-turn-helix domain-containing protein [Faecalimonas sp.]|nr:helix-turn-helix domain-containing protein [Faecalimonas sp.]
MLSNQVLHKIIVDIYKIVKVNCSVWSMEGACLASTTEENDKIGERLATYLDQVQGKGEKITKKGAFFLICDNQEPMYVFAIHEQIENLEVTGRLCVCQFEHLLQAYQVRVDKNRFYQNLLLDNMLSVDILRQGKSLGVDAEVTRVVFVIEPKQEKDSMVMDAVKSLYATGTKDYVTSVDESHIIYIRQVDPTDNYLAINHIAKSMVDTISAEVMVDVRVAYGTIVDNIKEVSRSYKEAILALDVGKIFYEQRKVLAYNELGIGRLIHQLPMPLCDMFIKEVFTKSTIDQLDEETIATVNLFFENSLNISETARRLYVHRNTLVYRLEKIQRITGLDVRVFDEALTFKIGMMVSKHMHALNNE